MLPAFVLVNWIGLFVPACMGKSSSFKLHLVRLCPVCNAETPTVGFKKRAVRDYPQLGVMELRE